MTSVSAFFNSPSAPSVFVRAFMAQSKAATLQSLSFFSGEQTLDMADFSRAAVDSSIVTSLIQGGNTALFGSIYKDAKGFNQSLMSSVAGAAGIHLDDNSLLGQLINKVA